MMNMRDPETANFIGFARYITAMAGDASDIYKIRK